MKTKSKFKALPAEDQERVIQLCHDNTFEKVVEILEKPRPEGLALKTSYSAVRRFYLQYHPHVQAAQVLRQYAHGLRIQHQTAEGSFGSAILLHVESRVLEALKEGQAIADLQSEIKTMINLQKAFIATEKWRVEAGDNAFKDSDQFLETCARAGIDDFKPAVPGDNTPFVEEPEPEIVEEDITDEEIAELDKTIASGDTNALRILCAVKGFPKELIDERRKLHGGCPSPGTATNSSQTNSGNSQTTPIPGASIIPFGPAHSSDGDPSQPTLAANSHQKTPVKPHYPPKATSSVGDDVRSL